MKPPYPRWVGLLTGLLLAGAAHVLAGMPRKGIQLFALNLGLISLTYFLFAVPGLDSPIPPLIFLIVSWVVWLWILKDSYRPLPRFGWKTWLVLMVAAALYKVGYLEAFKLLAWPYSIPTSSMAPTLQGITQLPDGTSSTPDHVFSYPAAYLIGSPQRGDLVVFTPPESMLADWPDISPETRHVKRLIGLPGDVIQITKTDVTVNGVRYEALTSLSPFDSSFTLGLDEYFLIGDNAANSYDCRHYGPIRRENIHGKVGKIYWPLARYGTVH